MTLEKEECPVINSSIHSHDDNTEESLGKRLHSVSNERDELRKQLQSAKDEIASLSKELLRWRTAAKAAYSDMFENIKTSRGPLPLPKGESVQETLRTTRPVHLFGKESDHVESESEEQEEEVCSQQGTDDSSHSTQESSDSAEEKNVLPSTDEEIRLRAARTLIWADSAIKRANNHSSSRSMGSPAPVPSTVHVSDVASNNSCSSTTSHSRPSRDGMDNDSLLSMDNYTPKNGPFAGIRRFLEETIDGSNSMDDDESLDESGLGIRDTDNDSTTPKNGPLDRIRRFLEEDNKALQNPPVSSYKYCNEAFQKLNEKNATRTFSASSPVAAAVVAAESKLQIQKPYCNQAFMKLNEKKSTAAFTMPKLFSGNR